MVARIIITSFDGIVRPVAPQRSSPRDRGQSCPRETIPAPRLDELVFLLLLLGDGGLCGCLPTGAMPLAVTPVPLLWPLGLPLIAGIFLVCRESLSVAFACFVCLPKIAAVTIGGSCRSRSAASAGDFLISLFEEAVPRSSIGSFMGLSTACFSLVSGRYAKHLRGGAKLLSDVEETVIGMKFQAVNFPGPPPASQNWHLWAHATTREGATASASTPPRILQALWAHAEQSHQRQERQYVL